MLELAINLRVLQFYAHHAHHICARLVFMPDHEFLSEIYTKAEQDYDDVIERYIGLNGDSSFNEAQLLSMSAQKVEGLSLNTAKDNKEMLLTCLSLIQQINSKIETLCKQSDITQGTLQLLGDQSNKNEILVYKLKQRTKSS